MTLAPHRLEDTLEGLLQQANDKVSTESEATECGQDLKEKEELEAIIVRLLAKNKELGLAKLQSSLEASIQPISNVSVEPKVIPMVEDPEEADEAAGAINWKEQYEKVLKTCQDQERVIVSLRKENESLKENQKPPADVAVQHPVKKRRRLLPLRSPLRMLPQSSDEAAEAQVRESKLKVRIQDLEEKVEQLEATRKSQEENIDLLEQSCKNQESLATEIDRLENENGRLAAQCSTQDHAMAVLERQSFGKQQVESTLQKMKDKIESFEEELQSVHLKCEEQRQQIQLLQQQKKEALKVASSRERAHRAKVNELQAKLNIMAAERTEIVTTTCEDGSMFEFYPDCESDFDFAGTSI